MKLFGVYQVYLDMFFLLLEENFETVNFCEEKQVIEKS